jgi:type II secretory pathway component PulJ
MAETSLSKTAELQQVLAQIEATLSRAELQKVKEKTNKR